MEEPVYILLIEDNKMDIELTLDAFKEAHLSNEIRVIENGEEALRYLLGEGPYTDRKKFRLPDLILLDLKLPGISGHDVLKKVKSTAILSRIPVIILTSSSDEGDRAMGYDSGVNSYLVKPVSFEGFLDVVKKIGEYWLTLNVKPPID